MLKSFEEGIYRKLVDDNSVTELLAVCGGSPAIDRITSPTDMNGMWGENPQFPRIVYFTEWSSQTDRIIAGKLIVYIFLTNRFPISTAEQIESAVNKSLSNVIFNTSRGVFCCSWQGSEYFNLDEGEPVILATRMSYDIRAFPDQRTFLDPDPVPAVNNFLHEADDQLLVINRDELPDILIPEYPVCYVRSLQVANAGRDTYARRYTNFKGMIHYICTDPSLTRKVMGRITQKLYIEGEINMEDNSQLLITDNGHNISVNYLNDSLLDGQTELDASFIISALKPVEGTLKVDIKGDLSYGNNLHN